MVMNVAKKLITLSARAPYIAPLDPKKSSRTVNKTKVNA
jgi:hypothetical protein